MPSQSLGTFNPTHFFHPLLREPHTALNPRKTFFLGKRTLGTNCPSKILRIVLVNQALEFSVFPPLARKLPGLAHQCYTLLTGLEPTTKKIDACMQPCSWVGAEELVFKNSFFVCFPLLPSMRDPKALPSSSDGSLVPGSQGRREWASLWGMALGLAEAGRHLGGCQRG